ncbi:tripartite tricarboxylate transporter permease [Thermodesulfobacteriota bacterium]
MGEIFAASIDGFLAIFSGKVFLWMMAGILPGMFFGLVPGLSGLSGLALLMPMAFGQPPEVAFPFLLGMFSVTSQTDTIPAILIGVPGTAVAQATVLDGYAMSKRGEAGRAMSASYMASIFGSIVAAFIFMAFLPILRPLIDSFGASEFFMMAMLGLVMAGSLAGTSLLRGLTMAGFGLMVSMVGFAPNTGFARFDFGWPYLWDGVPVVSIVLGLFAVPEVVDLLIRRTSIASERSPTGGQLQGIYDSLQNWWLVVKCGAIGAICGMIPGLGGLVAEWLGYGHAVQSAKDPSMFGKGDVRGVIAPEAATAGQKPGSILPTVAFGIPGNAPMAILLSVFFIVGLRPGPEMLRESLNITFLMVWVTVVANVIGAIICLAIQNWLVKICYLRPTILAPIILCFMLVGASLATKDFGDVLVFGVFGALGYIFKCSDWPRVPMLIGLVLGTIAETYLFIAAELYGAAFLWERPIVMVILAMIMISIALPIYRKYKIKNKKTALTTKQEYE